MNVDAIIKRAYLSLEDDDFAKANELLDQVLNEDPENAVVYVGLLCAELKVNKDSKLAKPFFRLGLSDSIRMSRVTNATL